MQRMHRGRVLNGGGVAGGGLCLYSPKIVVVAAHGRHHTHGGRKGPGKKSAGGFQKRLGDAVHTILVNNRNLKYARQDPLVLRQRVPGQHTTTTTKEKAAIDTAIHVESHSSSSNDETELHAIGSIETTRDPDLQYVLELASDDELEELCDCLHEASVFSPLGKTMYMMHERRYGDAVATRVEMEMYIESRFRFLAADVVSVITSSSKETEAWPTYRDILLDMKKRLGVPCSSVLATADLESEIFLHVLSQHAEYVGYNHDTNTAASIALDCVDTHHTHNDVDVDVDGVRTSSVSKATKKKKKKKGATTLHQLKTAVKATLLSPMSFGYKDIVPAVAKVATTLAVTRVQLDVLGRVARVVVQRAIHHRAIVAHALQTGSRGFATRVAVETAKQRLLGAVAKYTALRQLFVCVGPLMWISTAWDLAKLSLGTDYARLTRTVFMMAQIRLVRTRGWDIGRHNDDDHE